MKFGKDGCAIKKPHNGKKILAEGVRTSDNFYVIDTSDRHLSYVPTR